MSPAPVRAGGGRPAGDPRRPGGGHGRQARGDGRAACLRAQGDRHRGPAVQDRPAPGPASTSRTCSPRTRRCPPTPAGRPSARSPTTSARSSWRSGSRPARSPRRSSSTTPTSARACSGICRPRPAGTPFEVVFHMTETGLLQVHGREADSGSEVRFEIQIGGLDEAAVQAGHQRGGPLRGERVGALGPRAVPPEVLEPARQAGNVPPADLYVRYGLPSDISDPVAFGQQVDEVLDYWRELRSRRIYARLADALIARHAELAQDGPLTAGEVHRAPRTGAPASRSISSPGWRTPRPARRPTSGRPRWRGCAARSAGPSPTPRSPTRSSGPGSGSSRRSPQLPAAPHPKQADLAEHVRQLGQRLSAEVVFGDAVRHGFRVLGGFRLADARRLDEAALDAGAPSGGRAPLLRPGQGDHRERPGHPARRRAHPG